MTAMIDLAWVDEFIENVRPYIFVRLEDNLLIKRPNSVQKLNAMGARILKALMDGMTIREMLDRIGRDPGRTADVAHFLYAVKARLEGRPDAFSDNPAVVSAPFEMKFSDYPVLSEVALSYRCNLKCAFCYAGCGNAGKPAGTREMTTNQVKQVLAKIFHQAKAPSVSFSGGEPTLRPDLPDLVAFAKSLGMRVNLITNGTLISEAFAKTLADRGLDSAQVSIEGTSPKIHDRIVGVSGAFEKSVRAVGYLKDAGILTHSNTTLCAANAENCLDLPGFVQKVLKNDRFSMNLMIPAGSGAMHDHLILPYSRAGRWIEKIMEHSREAGVEFMWYSPLPMCMFNSVAHGLGNKGCSACDGLISVTPNGDVIPCASWDDPVGNLLTDDFEGIWHTIKAEKCRDKGFAHPFCRTCEDFHICNGACPLYWRKIGFAELEREKHIEYNKGSRCRTVMPSSGGSIP